MSRCAATVAVVVTMSIVMPPTAEAQIAPRALTISRTVVDFGGSPPGGTVDQQVIVSTPGQMGPFSTSIRGDPEFTIVATNCTPSTDENSVAYETCIVGLYFKPTSLGAKTATLGITARGRSWRIPLTGKGILMCRGNIVNCNYSDFYTGSFSWLSTVEMDAEQGHEHASNGLSQETTVTATVFAGKVTCTGGHFGKQTTWQLNKAVEMVEESGEISGPGLITIEFLERPESGRERLSDGTVSGPVASQYIIKVSCPTWKGRRISTSLREGAGPSETMNVESDPPSRDGEQSTDEQLLDEVNLNLSGDRIIAGIEHDPDNKVTARVRQKWSFRLTNAPPSAFPSR